MPEVVEDGEGFPPGRAGLLRTAGVLQVVAELGQRLGQQVLVAEVAEHAHGAAVAVEGLVAAAEVVAGGPEAGPGVALAVEVAALLVQRQRFLAAGQGLLVFSEPLWP